MMYPIIRFPEEAVFANLSNKPFESRNGDQGRCYFEAFDGGSGRKLEPS